MQKSVESVIGRAQAIDRQMQEYEAIVRREDRALSVLSSSSIVYFFISALVLAVATAGTAVNFTLIARPMAEMVGGQPIGAYRGGFAAWSSSWWRSPWGCSSWNRCVSRLFPVISALSDKTRVRMVIITFLILLLMASIEGGARVHARGAAAR